MTKGPAATTPQVVVVGPGAIGSLLACRLTEVMAAGGFHLTLLDHDPRRAARLAASGIRYEEDGRQRRIAVPVTANPSLTAADIILVCVKSRQVTEALDCVTPLLAAKPLLVFLQNGIGHLDTVRRIAAATPVALAVTALGATLPAPGHVRFGGSGLTRIGAFPPENAADPRLDLLAAMLRAAGVRTEIAADIMPWVWSKLLVNAAINPLSALHDCPNGALLEAPLGRQLEAVVREGALVAAACGVVLPEEPLARVRAVCRDTAANISSMLQDVRQRRPTEIEAINGALVNLAWRHGVAIPKNEDLLNRVRALEAAYLSP